MAKSPVFAGACDPPLRWTWVGTWSASALLAINLHPGETVQPWHFDDNGAKVPRPRPRSASVVLGVGDRRTEQRDRIIPGSHL
jgi:hypothetical protein